MGIFDKASDKLQELKGRAKQKADDSTMDDKAKAKMEEIRERRDSDTLI